MARKQIRPEGEAVFARLADYCSVMSNPVRLQIMWFLGDDERSVGDIAKQVGVTLQNASQHLRVMRDKGALESRKEGQSVFYRLASPNFLAASRLILEALTKHWRKRIS